MTNKKPFTVIENKKKNVSPIYYWAVDATGLDQQRTFYYIACGRNGSKEHCFAQDYYGKGIEPLLESADEPSYGTLNDLAEELRSAEKQGYYPAINAVAPRHARLREEVCKKGTLDGKEFYEFVHKHPEYLQLLPNFEHRPLNHDELITLRNILGLTPLRIITAVKCVMR